MPMVLKVLPALAGKQQSTGLLYLDFHINHHFCDHFSLSVHSPTDNIIY